MEEFRDHARNVAARPAARKHPTGGGKSFSFLIVRCRSSRIIV
jgi:hypothetical protein